ncbi:MAG: DUF1653 domain-containing protein [Clostridia bacterium]|nr:DUF1653 domain-containing protein [Clostridia bacterium]
MKMEIKVGGTYRHYKGNLYKVLYLATHTETEEKLVVYQDLKDESKVWARPVSMWNETVKTENGEVLRFESLS